MKIWRVKIIKKPYKIELILDADWNSHFKTENMTAIETIGFLTIFLQSLIQRYNKKVK